MKRFSFELWEYAPQWELRIVHIEAENIEKAKEYIESGDIVSHDLQFEDCLETIYDDNAEFTYELPDDYDLKEYE